MTTSLNDDDLLAPFHEAHTTPDEWVIGTEAEKFGVLDDRGTPLPFKGDVSIATLLTTLQRTRGWKPYQETTDGPTIALLRDGASMTLEPGGQVELSGAPLKTIHETRDEFATHHHELAAALPSVRWLGLGFHPTASLNELPKIPKLRYAVMREYMPTRGKLALDMMVRTCTVQANFDYENEEDAMRKLRIALRLQPTITAMFANSPWVEGRTTPMLSYRAHVWLHMDPDRSGLLPFAWNENARYVDYINWALDVPMFMFKRGDRVHHNTGQTFRAFMRDGFANEYPTQDDWVVHLATVFPEVRLKKTLEVRGADMQQGGMLFALPALWKGLLYDAQSLDEAEQLTRDLSFENVERDRPGIASHALRATLGGTPLREWAERIVSLAHSGLNRIDDRDVDGRNESQYLEPLERLVSSGDCPADVLRRKVPGEAPDRTALLMASDLET